MIAADNVAVLLLAAGASRRFGPSDKLTAPLRDVPLGIHAARTLARFPFAARIVVTRDGGLDYRPHGFTPVVNPDPDGGQSGSIALGVACARRCAPDAVLIALADMPLVGAAHIDALLARFDERNAVVASTAGGAPGPPALFGAALFDELAALGGDRGARHLLQTATLVAAPQAMLADIDTPADLMAVTGRPPAL